jgi:homeodomain-containing protein
MDKYRVALTVKERLELAQVVSIGKAAARKLTHARILLVADERCGEAYADAEIVSALSTSPRTIERLWKRCVTEGLEAALDHLPQPPRPDKVKGNVEQTLLELACSDPPRGRCHWTLQLLADELVVLGLVDTISTVTVWQALKKMTSSPGSSRPGASPPRRMPSASGAWRMCCRPICCPTIRAIPWCASMKHARNCSAKCDQHNGRAGIGRPGSIMSMSGRGSATN